MKIIFAILAAVSLSACATTTTKNADGSTTSTSRPDPKVIKELEPLVEELGAGAVQGALQYIQNQQGSPGPVGDISVVKIVK